LKALVTGSSKGIGKEIAKALLALSYDVIGVARDFEGCEVEFQKVECDLSEPKRMHHFLESYKKEDISLLVNCAGVGNFAPHEELSSKKIESMIYLNLTAPLLLTKTFLRSIKKNRGYIFNISSISAIKDAPFGATYGATKAGLRHFSHSLFSEVRKSGVKVVSINPDITNSSFFKDLHFFPDSDPLSFIEPECIAKIITDILQKRDGTVITDITVEPQIFKLQKKRS